MQAAGEIFKERCPPISSGADAILLLCSRHFQTEKLECKNQIVMAKLAVIMVLHSALLFYLLSSILCQQTQGQWISQPTFVQHTSANGPKESKDKCEIEIFTRGSCLVNNNRVKPQVILNFEHKQYSSPDSGYALPSNNQPTNRYGTIQS